MTLTWKDLAATLLVGSAGVVSYAKVKGFDWPLLGSWRVATALVFALGMGTCIVVGSGVTPNKDSWTIAATILGILAFILLIAGLALSSKLILLSLIGDVALLWAISTFHHIISTSP